jgi:hypothetical protein
MPVQDRTIHARQKNARSNSTTGLHFIIQRQPPGDSGDRNNGYGAAFAFGAEAALAFAFGAAETFKLGGRVAGDELRRCCTLPAIYQATPRINATTTNPVEYKIFLTAPQVFDHSKKMYSLPPC